MQAGGSSDRYDGHTSLPKRKKMNSPYLLVSKSHTQCMDIGHISRYCWQVLALSPGPLPLDL